MVLLHFYLVDGFRAGKLVILIRIKSSKLLRSCPIYYWWYQ